MSKDKNVTAQVKSGFPDDEYLPIKKCVCGKEFDMWEHTISMEKDEITECPACGRNMYFKIRVQVFEVVE